MTWTPVVDVSRHQGTIDFRTMRARGVVGLIFRATHGRTVDDRLHTYYRDALAAGYPADQIGFYSFINPKRGDATSTAFVNATTIRDLTGRTDVLYMLDVESYRQEGPNIGTVTLTGAAFALYLRHHRLEFEKRMPGCRVIAYSNAAFWNSNEGPNDPALAADLEWIVPRYPVYSHAGYYTYPLPGVDGWDEWAFARKPAGPIPPKGATWDGWQFSAGYNRQGPVYGCQSSDLDLNIVKTEAWQRWTATTPAPEPAPVPPSEEDDMAYLIRPANPVFAKGLFTPDGHPASPELRDAVLADGGKIVDQDHAHWDAATLHKMGPDARKLYDPTFVPPATGVAPTVDQIADELADRLDG